MSHSTYHSPLASRYASDYMLRLFSDDSRYQTWRRPLEAPGCVASVRKEAGAEGHSSSRRASVSSMIASKSGWSVGSPLPAEGGPPGGRPATT